MQKDMQKALSYNVLFLCIRNRVRSVFSELFTREKLKRMEGNLSDKIKVRSAGFFPEELKVFLDTLAIAHPDPFYGLDMSEHVRRLLLEKGIAAPIVWNSQCVTPAMIKEANLIVVSLPEQKNELSALYPEYKQNIVTLKEIAKWKGDAFSEDHSEALRQDDVWDHWEENPEYVFKTIEEVEKLLTIAIPIIVKQLINE